MRLESADASSDIPEVQDHALEDNQPATDAGQPATTARSRSKESKAEITALKTALDECWTLCNTLAGLSSIHRERIFNVAGTGDMHEQAWKSCWKLCQKLYDTRDEDHDSPRPAPRSTSVATSASLSSRYDSARTRWRTRCFA